MNDAIDRYYERVSLGQEEHGVPALKGSLMKPVAYDKIPDILQSLIGGAPAERARLLGLRTAEMHIALAAHPDVKDFEPEAFSLHYQRSLYSSLQTLVRTTYQTLERSIKRLPEPFLPLAEEVQGMKKDVLQRFKSIYDHKIEALKIRTHGDYHLGQVLFTGRDFVILDFEGEPARSYSERRLKRSPLRDVAGMLRSFHYAAYNSLFHIEEYVQGNADHLDDWAEQWNHYMSGFYPRAYLEKTKGHSFIHTDQGDFNILIQTFLLEKAIYELNYELNNRPSWSIIPMKGIQYVMDKFSPED
jgi:maltose alpha-D-glucosyltransferase/alpha-amylase